MYEVKFTNERNQTEYSIKQEWLSLYVWPRPVVIWSDVDHVYKINTVSEGVYGNILWWQQNDVESDNVTIIAWEKNTVLGWNEDATILWWIENEIKEWEWSRTAILVWWYKNHIYSSKGWTTIIWWNENDIKNNASDVTILWWSNNEVGWNNVIVWWRDVKVADNQQDIFVFNNDSERDVNISSVDSSSSDTFYIYSKWGLWINTEASTNGVEAKWWISLGTIDITNKICNDKTLWLIWMWEWCLVWCTEKSRELGWWELINPTEKDKEECEKNNKCIDTSVPYEDTILEVDGSCNNWLVDEESLDPERSTICGNPSLYKNIVFETTLIDSAYKEDWGESWIKCPQAGWDQRLINNQCVYQCNEWYHLLKDETNKVGGRSWKIWCYKDCMLDWVPVKHNETIDWYNVREVTCSNNEYVFPFISFRQIIYLDNRLPNWKSPETCGNYEDIIKSYWYV